MSRAISRESFNELKQYIGVHLQQGRVILDSDWNEGQDIMANLARRLGQDAFGDGVLGEGFEIQPVIPSPWKPGSLNLFELSYFQGHLPVSMRFPPTEPFDSFESMDGWAIEKGTGKLRISRDQPYEGRGFLRLSDHTGEVTVAKTLTAPADLSAFQYAHFWFRLNHDANVPSGAAKFFIEDMNGNRNLWPLTAPWAAKERWFPGAALPLDLRFHLFDIDLLPATTGNFYRSLLPTFPTNSAVNNGVTFHITPDHSALPEGLGLTPTLGAPYYCEIEGIPQKTGAYTFTVNATSSDTTVSRTFTLRVLDKVHDAPLPAQLLELGEIHSRALDFWKKVHAQPTTSNGTPANLSSIRKYGFIVSQQGAAPSVWDFDALHFSSRSAVDSKFANDFVIGGPLRAQALSAILNTIQVRDASEDSELARMLVALPQTSADLSRSYVGGYACIQQRETLYSSQRDPSEPEITAPRTGVRRDLVYLDVTREPVTYIDDPDLREVALGGPDTSTRMRIRQRVRVASDGALPSDSGIGGGRLATEGNYTDQTNRLYLVEVDTAGDIGTATVRWSDDNGSTIQRVIEPVSTGSTKIKVEDASSFRPGDFILLRTEFVNETHRVAGIVGNTITLQAPGGVSSTLALSDRPWAQRWSAFHVPVVADVNDSTISAPITLSHGVAVRISGRALKKGDFWTFRTRHLASSEASGIRSASRIETIDFAPPQGVLHQYMPLAQIVRDPRVHFPDRVQVIHDQRRRAGQIVLYRQDISLDLTAIIKREGDFVFLGPTTPQSALLCLWSGIVQYGVAQSVKMTIDIDFFRNDLTLPTRGDGKIDETFTMSLNYDNNPVTRSVFMLIPRVPVPGIIAARATYTVAQPISLAQGTTGGGTLTLIEFKDPPRDFSTFPSLP